MQLQLTRVFSNIVLSIYLGNRWIQPLFTVLPHKTPPLDLSELESGIKPQQKHEVIQYHDLESHGITEHSQEFMEMQQQKRESEI